MTSSSSSSKSELARGGGTGGGIGAFGVVVGSVVARGRLRRPRRRGMALFLVLVAVAVGVVLGCTFLVTSSASSAASSLARDRLQARLLAESGLALARQFMRVDPDWRTKVPNGLWAADQPLGGGTFSVWGEDGDDVDEQGNVIGGDGDLANGARDPVVLTSVATYGSARCRVRAVLEEGLPSPLAAEEQVQLEDDAVIDNFASTMGGYGAGNSGASAAVACNSVGEPNIDLSANARIQGTLYFPRGANPSYALKLSGTATITGGTGNLTVEKVPIATSPEPTYEPSTVNRTYSGTSVTTISSDLACAAFTLRDDAVLRVAGDVNLYVDGPFNVVGRARLVLDNPVYGNATPFSQTGVGAGSKQVAVRVHVPDTLAVRYVGAYLQKAGKVARMAIYRDLGGGAAPGALVAQSASQTLANDAFHWHEAEMPAATLTPGYYWLALSLSDDAAGYRYDAAGAAHVRNNAATTNGFLADWGASDAVLARNLNIYVTGNVEGKGGSLTVYARSTATISDQAQVNLNTRDPRRLVFRHLEPTPTARLAMARDAVACMTFHARDSMLNLTERARFLGLVRCREAYLAGDSVLEGDTAEGTVSPGVLFDEKIRMTGNATIRSASGDAVVACNAVGTPVIWLRDRSMLRGDAYGGPGGAGGNTAVKVGSQAKLTGEARNLAERIDMSLPPPPALPASSDDLAFDSGTQTISASRTCRTLSINKGVVEVVGDVTLVVTDHVRFYGGELKLRPGARLTVYCDKMVSFKSGAKVNVGGAPSRVVIHYAGTHRVDVNNDVQVAVTLRAPLAEVRMKDHATWLGSVLAKRITLQKYSSVHYDSSGPMRVRWIDGR